MTDSTAPPRIRRAIEDSFPIVEINRLAVPERNAFKPIYQMHKWFARRASCVFRAILLGCLKPLPVDENGKPTKTGAQVIMEEFYKDHTNDPDTNGKVILDPFMGGGTTVVEALRLGCKVIGIDLNPVAWFIVKTEVKPVDLDALQQAFDRLAERTVPWSGKPLRETLLSLYRTECPCCGAGRDDADIIYTFWVKSAICTACGKQVPLFKDYIISQKSPSIRYYRDASCPRCRKTFDWEIEPAALVAEPRLQINSPTYSAGAGRSTTRWAYSSAKTVSCPWCFEEVTALPSKSKPERKKVPLSVLLCPHCESVWQWRGEIPDAISCPVCKKDYSPLSGNVPGKGMFLCSCGHTDDIIRSVRRLPEDLLLPISPYAIEGYCCRCDGNGEDDEIQEQEMERRLFQEMNTKLRSKIQVDHPCRLTKNSGKFFKRMNAADLSRIVGTTETWERQKARLPYPKQTIPIGEKTKTLLGHHYRRWHQMFHPRQLLSLSALFEAIIEESDTVLQDLLLSTFQSLLERNNLFCRYFNDRNTVQGSFTRHDYHPINTPAEASVWGREPWRGTGPNLHARTLMGKSFALKTNDPQVRTEQFIASMNDESIYSGNSILLCSDSRRIDHKFCYDVVVTDPPYIGNVNYAELADFFYVWLQLALQHRCSEFIPDLSPKMSEIIENPTRGLDNDDFKAGLSEVLSQSALGLEDCGLVVFTFHHSQGGAWETVLNATFEAGLEIAAAYPVHSEKESSSNLMDTQGISYDLIHVCRKRDPGATQQFRPGLGFAKKSAVVRAKRSLQSRSGDTAMNCFLHPT